MSFRERLKEQRENIGMSRAELAEILNVTSAAIGNYENGISTPKADILFKVFDALKCDANYLFQDEMNELKTETFTVPEIKMVKKYRSLDNYGKDLVNTVLEKEYTRSTAPKETATIYNMPFSFDLAASAGTGEYAMDIAHFKTVGLTEKPPRGADFLIRISGNSMEPKFYDDDKVFIKRMDSVDVGEIGLFYVDGDVYIKKQGVGELISLNPNYKPIPIYEFSSAKCFGKVLGRCECEIVEI